MTATQAEQGSRAKTLKDAIRGARARYDQLARGQTAVLRRCRTASEVALEGTFWRVAGALGREQRQLPQVVLLFPLASHSGREKFSFGGYLRRQLPDGDGSTLRFRRLLDSRDSDELSHRLRGILKLAGRDSATVDWGALGLDILWFFAESDDVRRRWAQDFYAPQTESSAAAPAPSAPSTSSP